VANTDNQENVWQTFAIIFFSLSVFFTIIGIYNLYSGEHIVGGDAYNFIIVANRGIGWICTGIVLAILGLTCAMTAIYTAYSRQKQVQFTPTSQTDTPEADSEAAPQIARTHMGTPVVDRQVNQ
jgi:hypothetical protein